MSIPNLTEDKRLESALESFYTAFNDRNIERLLALFEPHAVYITGSGQYAGNRTDIRAALQQALDLETRIIQGPRQTIIAGDIALMMSNWSQVPDSAKPDALGGTSTIVFRRQPDGEWLIVIDNPIGTDLLDPMQGDPPRPVN